jgi:hypothetical protein
VIKDTELREILRATAQRASLPSVMPQSMRRKVALRRARTIGVTFLMTVGIVAGGLQGIRAVTLDDAAPVQPADETEQVVPAYAEALLEDFLQARIEGEGAEGYVEIVPEWTTTGGAGVPLLYATTNGAPYEGFEFERGPDRPEGMEFEVRLFAEGGETVVEQRFFIGILETGRLGLEYRPTVGGIAATTENGDSVPVPYGFFDGEVTLHAAHPWTERVFLGPALTLDQNIGEERLELLDNPRPETGCGQGPAPADAVALARAIRSDPNLAATAPVMVTVGGIDGLRMDVKAVPGASVCETYSAPVVLRKYAAGGWRGAALEQGSRMRLYLLNAPEGTSTRILAISIVASEPRFGRVMEAAQPVLDSIEISAR